MKHITYLLIIVAMVTQSCKNDGDGSIIDSGILGDSAAIASDITGITYPYHVYVPKNYHYQRSRQFPVIYATDAQWVFQSFAHTIQEKNLDVILVGIEQGPVDSDRRAVDYTFPGVHDYYRFFTEEFMPQIESEYRIQSTNRTLQGASLGGLLAMCITFIQPIDEPLFDNFLIYDPAVWYFSGPLLELISNRISEDNHVDSNWIVTTATGGQGNHYDVELFMAWLTVQDIQGLTISEESHAVHHNNAADASFEDSLDQLYE